MKKIIVNFYLLVVLVLAAQAILVVFNGNTAIADNLSVKAMQRENSAIQDRLNALEDKITRAQSVNTLLQQATEASEAGEGAKQLVSIGKREAVLPQTLASLE